MKLKKRKKISRQRGGKTHGWGAKQRHRGKGCQGGKGMAGSGKRADQKKQKALMIAKKKGVKEYFGKQGLTSRGTAKKKNNVINLEDIKEKFGEGKIELKDYKILGQGEGFKGEIVCGTASKGAVEKMEKAGGKITIIGKEKLVGVEKEVKEKVGKKGE